MVLAGGMDVFQSSIMYLESIGALRPPLATIYEELGVSKGVKILGWKSHPVYLTYVATNGPGRRYGCISIIYYVSRVDWCTQTASSHYL